MTKRIVLIGATSSIAEHCARLWQESEPVTFFLVARNEEKLARVVADLQSRQPTSVFHSHVIDFNDVEMIQSVTDKINQDGPVDLVLIAHGWLGDQATSQTNLKYCQEMLEVNGVSPLLFAEAFASYMEKARHGQLVLIGSVAGDRGRKSIYVYGAAKACLAHYAEGLQSRFCGTGVSVTLVKPGPTQTPMIAHLKLRARAACVEEVARQIVRGVQLRKRMIYVPKKWRWIMWIVKLVPNCLFDYLEL